MDEHKIVEFLETARRATEFHDLQVLLTDMLEEMLAQKRYEAQKVWDRD